MKVMIRIKEELEDIEVLKDKDRDREDKGTLKKKKVRLMIKNTNKELNTVLKDTGEQVVAKVMERDQTQKDKFTTIRMGLLT